MADRINAVGNEKHGISPEAVLGENGLIVGLNRGGSAVIKHYGLRLTLWLNCYAPFKLVKFLDHCARLILLKKVGGGYIFIHPMLLEYFAELTPQLPTHVAEMESAYSGSVKVVTVIGGDFNTDPTDGQAVMRAATQRVKSLATV